MAYKVNSSAVNVTMLRYSVTPNTMSLRHTLGAQYTTVQPDFTPPFDFNIDTEDESLNPVENGTGHLYTLHIVMTTLLTLAAFLIYLFLLIQTLVFLNAQSSRISALYGFLLNIICSNILWFGLLFPMYLIHTYQQTYVWTAGKEMCRFFYYLLHIVHHHTIYAVVLLCIYMAVNTVAPRLIARFNHLGWATGCIAICLAIEMLAHIWTALNYSLVNFNPFTTDEQHCVQHFDSLFDIQTHMTLYVIASFALPFLLMVTCSLVLISLLCGPNSDNLYHQFDSNAHVAIYEQRRVAATLVALTITFGVCCAPLYIFELVIFFNTESRLRLHANVMYTILSSLVWLMQTYSVVSPIILYIYLRPYFLEVTQTMNLPREQNSDVGMVTYHRDSEVEEVNLPAEVNEQSRDTDRIVPQE